jgi:hypothetical protein
MSELIVTIPAIVVICYLIGEGCKASEKIRDNLIPIIVGVCGGVLGVVGMYTIAGFPADNVLNALAVGIMSGLAATGCDQAVKQILEMKKE